MKYILPDKVYNILKWVCIVALPILAWAYGAYAAEWNWPLADQINNTIHITAALLGALLGLDEFQAKVLNSQS